LKQNRLLNYYELSVNKMLMPYVKGRVQLFQLSKESFSARDGSCFNNNYDMTRS